MEQHPIPQQISSYEFKLVGEMTLKQFGKAAVGIVLALLVNSTGLIFFIKWPLMLVLGGGGLLLAFVPFEDRPLENWVFSFIKSIYSPTIFLYKKRASKNWLDLDMKKTTEEKPEIQNPPLEKGEILKETKTDLGLKTEKLEATGKAIFGAIPMPDIPDIPNIIVGMATDDEGKIIEGVIVEIQDEHGNPSRVLKTNSLGQFKTSTQLANGKYLLICEREGYKFDRINIDVAGEIIKPIRLIASKI